MGRSAKKPRQKMNAHQTEGTSTPKKKDKDWSFEDIARSKSHRR